MDYAPFLISNGSNYDKSGVKDIFDILLLHNKVERLLKWHGLSDRAIIFT